MECEIIGPGIANCRKLNDKDRRTVQVRKEGSIQNQKASVATKQKLQSVNKGLQEKNDNCTGSVRVDATASRRLGSNYVQKNNDTEKEAGQNRSVTLPKHVAHVYEKKV